MSVFMQPIFTQTVGAGGTGALTFSNIPQGFTDLKIVVSARSLLSGFDNLMLRFNNDTNIDNYSTTSVYADGVSVVSERVLDFYTLSYAAGSLPNALSAANTFGSLDVYIPNYTAATFKQIIIDNVAENNVASLYIRDTMGSSLYQSTAPITSVSVFGFGNLAQHSTVTLYGVSNVYDTGVPVAPTIGAVTDQAGFASVAFTPATNDRSKNYVVTSNPSGSVTYGLASPITTPTALGTAYTYQVAAVNSLGSSISAASASLTSDNSYASIATVTAPSGSISNFTFTNIPQNYKHLQLRFICRVASGNAADEAYLTFNGATTEMMAHQMYGDGSTTFLTGNVYTSVMFTTRLVGTGATANVFSVGIIDILDYNDTSKGTTVRTLSGWDANGSGQTYLGSGAWSNLSPVSSLTFRSNSNFAQYSHAALYGIA